ncbi:SGNH hydrolase-type esterase domain-containing protein [Tanacetum coccineum]
MNDIVTLHNQKLATKLKHLEKQLDGFMYSIFDISTAITNRMNNPSKYGIVVASYFLKLVIFCYNMSTYHQHVGFNEGETACCGSGPLRGIFSCGGKRGIPDYELCDNATEFLFFDSLHPNELASSQFAKMFWKGDPMVTGPYNLKALFDGCLSSQQAALFVFGDSLFDPGNNHHINTTHYNKISPGERMTWREEVPENDFEVLTVRRDLPHNVPLPLSVVPAVT